MYFAFSAIWILLSDRALEFVLGGRADWITTAQTFKGWAFVTVSAGLIYVMLKRELDARKRAENKISESEASFRYLFMNNPRPMWVYDRETLVFLDVNDAAVAQYGYTRDEFLAMKITDIRPPEDVPKLMDVLNHKRLDLMFSGLWRHRYKNGQIIDVEIVSHTMLFQGHTATLVLAQDITERKRMEASLLEQERLRAALDKEIELRGMRNRLISMMSHDFRTPMTTILTSTDMLDLYYDRMTAEARRDRLGHIKNQVKHMIEMLDDMLTMLRAEALSPEFKPIVLEVVTLCRAVAAETQQNTNQTHEIVFKSDCDMAMVKGDEKLLRRALDNLLTNAVKYSPVGSDVEMLVWCDKEHVGCG
jgi:PAS domain S-box-containing protein